MLLGILAASMTYQTGLKPPGGLWQDNNDGHYAGNPILHDTNKHRYNAFFYGNSTSFMASIVVVVMLLPLTLSNLKWKLVPFFERPSSDGHSGQYTRPFCWTCSAYLWPTRQEVPRSGSHPEM